MLVNKKTNELLNVIKNSKEYIEFKNAKKILLKYPKKIDVLEEYKQILLENQLEQFLNGTINKKKQIKSDNMYKEISKHNEINRFLIAEYNLKNILNDIFKNLNRIIESSDNENNYFFC